MRWQCAAVVRRQRPVATGHRVSGRAHLRRRRVAGCLRLLDWVVDVGEPAGGAEWNGRGAHHHIGGGRHSGRGRVERLRHAGDDVILQPHHEFVVSESNHAHASRSTSSPRRTLTLQGVAGVHGHRGHQLGAMRLPPRGVLLPACDQFLVHVGSNAEPADQPCRRASHDRRLDRCPRHGRPERRQRRRAFLDGVLQPQ